MASQYDEYEGYVKKYKSEYGEKTVVLYRCGGFFEIYSSNDGLIDMKSICNLLNIQMSRKNKSILEVNRSNTLMAGFPFHALYKFVNILVNNNYTVVIVDQISDPPKPKRAVTSIISPGTHLDNIINYENNNMMCVNVSFSKDFYSKKKIMLIGVSIIDLTTGTSKVSEFSSKANDYYFAIDELFRILTAEKPREIVVMGEDPGEDFFKYLELSDKCVHKRFDIVESNIDYYQTVLKKVFPDHGLLSVVEYLNLECMCAAMESFVFLLQFCFKHNENIIRKIKKPIIISSDSNLTLHYNCLRHLNIVSNDNNKSLLSILNKCSTSMGKRYFKNMLLNPITDKDELITRYSSIETMMKDNKYMRLRDLLKEVLDIERLYRKICIKTINPCELYDFYASMKVVLDVLSETDELSLFDDVENIIELIENTFDIQEIRKYNLDNLGESFFVKGQFEVIDDIQEEINKNMTYMRNIVEKMNSILKNDFFKLDFSQSEGYFLLITQKRYNESKKSLNDFFHKENAKEFRFDSNNVSKSSIGSSYKIFAFKEESQILESLRNTIKHQLLKSFNEFEDKFSERFHSDLFKIIECISRIDFFSTCARNAIKYNYTKPIINTDSSKSFVICSDIRHPIIELISTETDYIANDVKIGTEDVLGLLLYGTNMVGKSSYMKSIGISIILAQSGMFVPCSKFEYRPYRDIFTRIPSGDDLFKGKSTFAVEISELRNILKRANENSLVIGDELASGTESISAISIVGAGLVQLYDRNASFVFATHLHDLTKLQKIKEMTKLYVCHLSVIFDEIDNKLIFDRKLKAGQGSTLYGLEVCRALDLDQDFIKQANLFRYELSDKEKDIVRKKKSRYNAKVFVDDCMICHEKAVEVHHIRQQCTSDENGFIGKNGIHKNRKSNLIPVCEKCHQNIHHAEIGINGYVQTSNGIIVSIK